MRLSENALKLKMRRMIEDDRDVIEKFEAMDDMFNNKWELPDGMTEDDDPRIYKIVDSSPSDALQTAITTFSANLPKPNIQPLSPHPRDKARANNNEKNLRWQFMLCDNRVETEITRDAMESSLRYSKCCLQIIHLPTHFRAIGKSLEEIEDVATKEIMQNANERRMKAAMRLGKFLVIARNPKSVHHRYSEIGLECVLLEQTMTAEDIVNTWGDIAKQHFDTDEEEWGEKEYTYYDFTSYFQRSIAIGSAHGGPQDAKVIFDEENKVPFLSWAIRGGGSGIEDDPKYRYTPFLNNVYTSGSWERLNILFTISMTETLYYRFYPRFKDRTVDGRGVDVDQRDQAVHLRHNEEFDVVNPPPLDPNVMEMALQARGAIDAQTRIRVLQNPDFPSNFAFATINALLKTALNGLVPWRKLTEKTFSDMYRIMLLWVAFTGDPLIAHGTERGDWGEQYMIEFSLIDPTRRDFDPDYLYITTSLEPDLPVDKVEQVNVGSMLYNQLDFPLEYIMQELGIDDPQTLIRIRFQEEAIRNEWGNIMKMSAAAADAKIQAMMMQVQGAMQASASPQGGGPPGPPPQGMPGPPALQNAQGPGFDTAQGGIPPAMAYPGGTREQLAGEDMSGEEVVI
jgi:hypothetical protein